MMLKTTVLAVLMASVTLSHAQSTSSKKELAQKLVQLQQPVIEGIARQIVERPALQVMQAAGNALQTQVPPDKRQALAKSIEADVKQYVDDSVPLLRERALKLAPSTYGAMLEEKFSADELKQMLAWLESPVNKKLQQVGPEMQGDFTKKLVLEGGPLLDPRLKVLQDKIRITLGLPVPQASSAPAKAGSK